MTGFIQSAEKINTAQTVKQWFDNAIASIESLRQTKSSLINQLELMKINNDYSESDCLEVEELIATINKKITEL